MNAHLRNSIVTALQALADGDEVFAHGILQRALADDWPRCAACGTRFPTDERLRVHLRRDCLGGSRPVVRRLRPWRPA